MALSDGAHLALASLCSDSGRARLNHFVLEPDELSGDGTARLTGRRLQHAREVLHARAGSTVKVGVLHGNRGTAEVVAASEVELVLKATLNEPPPPRANADLVLAMPRPKQLKRVLAGAASMGVNRVVLLNAAKVEKSYFDSKVLDPAFLGHLVRLGLEQARDTVPPELIVKERFRPFVEDELEGWCGPDALRLLAHGASADAVPRRAVGQRAVIAVGPEGGWTPFELDLLQKVRFRPVTLGPRPLRVEVAVPALLGALG